MQHQESSALGLCCNEESSRINRLDGRPRDEEPLVDRSVNLSWWQILALWNPGSLAGADSIWRAIDSGVGQVDIASLSLALDQSLPSITAFSNHILGVFLVLAFAAEGELILG